MRGEKNIGGWKVRKDVKGLKTMKGNSLVVG